MYKFFFLLGFALLVLAIVIFLVFRHRVKIALPQKIRLREAWNDAIEIKDPARRVLEAEKVGDAVLKELGYTGTFAEKLQQAGPRLTNIDAIWNAHRLRNRIAHEVNVRVSAAQGDRALQAFAVIVHRFLS
ncbi:MAG: hypothetical protein PHO20_05120 [Candidatus Peribacteraceae bacterium]|nr:hypothetical protein [Candidatus Peribacteraceae bacterium]MDD5740117.1 hypothetical protein [Candidatus Peribacteraceae bacterium]